MNVCGHLYEWDMHLCLTTCIFNHALLYLLYRVHASVDVRLCVQASVCRHTFSALIVSCLFVLNPLLIKCVKIGLWVR